MGSQWKWADGCRCCPALLGASCRIFTALTARLSTVTPLCSPPCSAGARASLPPVKIGESAEGNVGRVSAEMPRFVPINSCWGLNPTERRRAKVREPCCGCNGSFSGKSAPQLRGRVLVYKYGGKCGELTAAGRTVGAGDVCVGVNGPELFLLRGEREF